MLFLPEVKAVFKAYKLSRLPVQWHFVCLLLKLDLLTWQPQLFDPSFL